MEMEDRCARLKKSSTVRRRELRAELFKRQHGYCYWCGFSMSLEARDPPRWDYATFEHLTPRHMGGKLHDNAVLAHCWCNNARGGSLGAPPHVSAVMA